MQPSQVYADAGKNGKRKKKEYRDDKEERSVIRNEARAAAATTVVVLRVLLEGTHITPWKLQSARSIHHRAFADCREKERERERGSGTRKDPGTSQVTPRRLSR